MSRVPKRQAGTGLINDRLGCETEAKLLPIRILTEAWFLRDF